MLKSTGQQQGPQIRAMTSDPRVLRSHGDHVSKGQIGWPEVSLKGMTKLAKIPGTSWGLRCARHAYITASSPPFTDKAAR